MTLTFAALPASPLEAQAPASPDSILARLERAEEQIALLRQQLATAASSGVQSRSGARVEVWARALANGWRNSGTVNNLDVPVLAFPNAEERPATLGMVLRQTTVGLDFSGVSALGAEVVAAISGDLYGGVQSGSGNRRLFPEPRLRIARAVLRWPMAEIMVGQDVPLIAEEDPVSLASIGIPGFAQAGNLWFWLPQARVSIHTATPVRLGLHGAVMGSWSGDDPAGNGNVDAGERSGRPAFEGRVNARWGEGPTSAEVGVGAHVGWVRRSGDTSLTTSRAIAITARIPVGWFELRGEAYRGQVLRGLGGGGIGQNFGILTPAFASRPLQDRGAWAQVNLRPTAALLVGTGCGVDDPRDDEGPQRLRNQACEAHLHLRPAGPLVLGLEVRHLRTNYRIPRTIAMSTHLNLSAGVEF